MIRHVALLKWKDGTTEAQVIAIEARLRQMPDVMPFLRRYELGPDLGITGNHDLAIVADFDSVEDYLAYADHPDHKAVITELIAPVLESISRVQYTV
ncbi:MAG: Dabb family protein [Acidimicrobiia bacterium]